MTPSETLDAWGISPFGRTAATTKWVSAQAFTVTGGEDANSVNEDMTVTHAASNMP